MTERLYYRDSYLTAFEAAVLDRADEGCRLYLDRTAFYPTSGGQPHDLGRLGGQEVVDVLDESDRIAHVLAAPVTSSRVSGEVAWDRRFDHMQQHSGQHLLSAVLEEMYDFRTVSVHFGQAVSTLDLDAPMIEPGQVAAAESRANAVLAQNRAVEVSFEEAAAAEGLRKASDRSGTLRIVTIDGVDRSACGGTHVRTTGEIGSILIGKTERVRKSARLEFVCGGRAVRHARADHELLARLAGLASAAPEELPGLWDRQREELKAAVAAHREVEAELDRSRARELHAAAPADVDGLRRVIVTEAGGRVDRLRGLAQAVAALPRVVFVGVADSPPGLVIATSGDSGRDAAAMLKAILGAAGGRGGGTPRLAQGTLPAEALAGAIAVLGR